MRRADHRGGWREYKNLYKSIFHWEDGMAQHRQAPGCVRIHVAMRAHARPLPLQHMAPLRVSSFV